MAKRLPIDRAMLAGSPDGRVERPAESDGDRGTAELRALRGRRLE